MGATVSRVLLLQQLLVIETRRKRRREGGAKQAKASLTLNQTSWIFHATLNKACSIEPTLWPPYLCTMTTALTVDSAQIPFPPSNQRSTTKEGGWKFFFVQIFLFWRSFLLLRNTINRTLFFNFLLFSFHKKTFIINHLFLKRHFLVFGVFFWFFSQVFGFFRTASFTSSSLCVFLLVSKKPMLFPYHLIYRTST